jgi:uncharacterized protein (TIGR02569 family)
LTDRPPVSVLAAFDVDPRGLRRAPGGQGNTWRARALILKPLDRSVEQLAWEYTVLSGIEPDGFRLAPPVRSRDGRLAVDGWSAWELIAGVHLPDRWADICAVGDRFHRAAAGIPAPAWHRERNDPWARADRAAWDDAALDEFRSLAPVDQLAASLRPVHGHDQLVHGDLSGNVLFHPTLPPGVIDISPYWRPVLFGTAVVIIDALMWEGASDAVLKIVEGRAEGPQCLLRAAIFRLVTDHLCNPRRRRTPPWWPDALRMAATLCRLAETTGR